MNTREARAALIRVFLNRMHLDDAHSHIGMTPQAEALMRFHLNKAVACIPFRSLAEMKAVYERETAALLGKLWFNPQTSSWWTEDERDDHRRYVEIKRGDRPLEDAGSGFRNGVANACKVPLVAA